MNGLVQFFVPGLPQPGGSKRAFIVKGLGRAVITDANPKAKDWKTAVSLTALANNVKVKQGPLRVSFDFYFPRPKGHFGSGKNAGQVKPSAPTYHTVKPDCTKVIRSTEDALTGIAWADDSQIADQRGVKLYADPGEPIGALVTIEEMGL